MLKHFVFILGLTVLLGGCNNGGVGEEKKSDAVQEELGNKVQSELCVQNIEDFTSFLGLPYGTNERELIPLLGKFSSGNFSADSNSFIYYYNHIKRVPISIWVNGKTGDVETIFMEILGFESTFEADVEAVQERYAISACDIAWFGMEVKDIQARLGAPTATSVNKEGVTSISYDSKQLSHSVNFKVYPSQGDICSSITINWFYE